MKNIIVFGNKQITIKCLEILKKNRDVNLVAVVGCETENDLKIGNPSIRKFCIKNKLTYFQPNKLDNGFLKTLKKLKPDICFSLFYRDIFSKQFLAIAKQGFINIHPSLLPKYRGPVPYLWALLNNEKLTGVSLHYIDQGIDSGDIISQIKYKIPGSMTGFELGNELMNLGIKLFKKQLPPILKGINKRVKQDHTNATYYGKYNSSLRKINWYNPSRIILKHIQAFTKPFSGATAVIAKKEIIFWKSIVVNLPKQKLQGPGIIIKTFKNGKFLVSTVDGFLRVEEFEITAGQKHNFKKGQRFNL